MDEALLVALRLAKDGFGTAAEILETPAPLVLAMLNYSSFLVDYQETYAEINRENPAK